MKLSSIGDVLRLAISREIKAQQLYVHMATMVDNPWLQTAIEDIARDERRHKVKLEAVRIGSMDLPHREVEDLGLADILDDIEPHPDMTYRELLALAIKKENSASRLYETMANAWSEPDLKALFKKLAAEEADHKHRFEMQYEQLTS